MELTSQPFRFRPGQPVVWFHRDAAKSNQHCLYCGAFVGAGAMEPSNKEHLIGRQFVPLGYLDGESFNLIFRACVACNKEKDGLERHLSTVTLFSSPTRASVQEVDELALRKASKDFHPDRKGILVKDASTHNTIEFSSGRMRTSFKLSGPPQPSEDAVAVLACRHVQGLFSLITSPDPTKAESTRLLPANRVYYFGHLLGLDWGNPQLVELSKIVSTWDCPARIITAHGFFKAVLRRPHIKGMGWFWALEWNQCLRIVGGIASLESELPFFNDLPDPGWQVLPGGTSRIREEIPLKESEDLLFVDPIYGSESVGDLMSDA